MREVLTLTRSDHSNVVDTGTKVVPDHDANRGVIQVYGGFGAPAVKHFNDDRVREVQTRGVDEDIGGLGEIQPEVICLAF